MFILVLSSSHLNTGCLCESSSALPLSPVRSGGRILILVRQPDPRFTPRVWLVPIVHCQGLLMERQQWILSPHKWLSDRAPSSITSYNVEVQKMRPSGGLIWCFICSFEKLLSFFFPLSLSLLQNNILYKRVHTCTYVNRINLSKTARRFRCSVHAWLCCFNLFLYIIRWPSSPWPGCRQWSNIPLPHDALRCAFNQTLNLIAFPRLLSPGVITLSRIVQLK